MNEAIKNAIQILTNRAIEHDTSADSALKFTQAAVNLTHVGMGWIDIQRESLLQKEK